jgi:hypothetical protein
MVVPAPLPALLVALAIDFDNTPRSSGSRTGRRGPAAGRTGGVWLVSPAMWGDFLRLVHGRDAPFEQLWARPR